MTVTVMQQETTSKPSLHPPKGRFSINLIANVLNFGISVLIGLWFTPYLIHHLGVAAYGLVPLAMTVTSFLSLLTMALNGAVGRFLTIALERHQFNEADSIFNTSLVGSVLITLVLLVPTFWLSGHANWFFNVPAGYETQFVWLFDCTIGMFLLTTIGSAFTLSSFCRNRFDLSNAVAILGNLARVGLVVVLFSLCIPAVWHVGVGMLVSAVIGLIGSILVWRYLTPMLRIRPRCFSWDTLRCLFATGGWMVLDRVGSLLYLSIDLLVVNKMIGAEAGGHYGALMQWSAMLRAIGGTVAGVFSPTILSLYAHNDKDGLVRYSRQAVKFLGLVIALPIGIICGLSRPLLTVWLGKEFAVFAPLMSLMTIHLCVNLGVLPLFNISTVTNRVRLPGIITCVMGVMNLGLAILLAGPMGWGMYGVAAAGAIMLTAKNLIFTPLYAAHVLGLGYGTFFRETIPIIGATGGVAGVAWLMAHCSQLYSWTGVIGAGIALTGAYFVVAYTVMLSKDEKVMALRMVAPLWGKR